jgi:hypothetical protein
MSLQRLPAGGSALVQILDAVLADAAPAQRRVAGVPYGTHAVVFAINQHDEVRLKPGLARLRRRTRSGFGGFGRSHRESLPHTTHC